MRTQFFFGVIALALSVVACADVDADDEDVGSAESEIAYGDRSFVQIYNANLKHLSEPGKPSFEGTDYTQLLSFMQKQDTLPDILTLQEIGTKTDKFSSQSCDSVLTAMDRIVKPSGWKTHWKCIVASGGTGGLGNAPGGVAIIHRARFEPSGAKKVIGLYRWSKSGCEKQPAGSGWSALVQKFDDGKKSIAVASIHLPTAGDSDGNAIGDDCSGKNLALVEDALAATHADVKIMAGDMNHGDATRHLDAKGAVVHDWWEHTYKSRVAGLSSSAYRDPFFDACNGSSQCLESEHWTMNNKGALDSRIDWVLVAGATKLEGAKTIKYAEVNPKVNYSDHRAQMLKVVYR